MRSHHASNPSLWYLATMLTRHLSQPKQSLLARDLSPSPWALPTTHHLCSHTLCYRHLLPMSPALSPKSPAQRMVCRP